MCFNRIYKNINHTEERKINEHLLNIFQRIYLFNICKLIFIKRTYFRTDFLSSSNVARFNKMKEIAWKAK